MPRKLIVFIICLLLLSAISVAQTTAIKKTGVTLKDQRELQRLSKLIVKRYQQTRDLKPIIHEFFLEDFDSLSPYGSSSTKGLTQTDCRRFYIATMNVWYIGQLFWLLGEKDESLERFFPEDIVKEFKAIDIDKMSNSFNAGDVKDSQAFLKDLQRLEQLIDKTRSILKRKNYEKSPQYKKQFAEDEKSDWLGYPVTSDVRSDGIRYNGSSGRLRFPPGTKIYSVSVPIQLVINLVRIKGRYKVLFIDIYDH